MKILVLGCGSIGRRHIGNLLHLGYSDLVVADPNERSLELAKKIAPNAAFSSDPDAELGKGSFDAIFVCSPPQCHLAQLDTAIESGAHVFVEKPFSLTAEGVEEVLKKADTKKNVVMTAFNMRYLELIQKMRGWLEEGRIGRVLGCRICLSSYMPVWHPDEDYREGFMAFWHSGGGALFDYVHGIDLVQWMAGEIDTVACMQRTTLLEMETDDVSTLSCTTKDGAVCSFYFDFVDRIPRKSLELIGSEGTMIWEYDKSERLTLFRADDPEAKKVTVKENYAQCYIEELVDFFNAIDEGRKPLTDGWNGLSTQQVLDMAMKSNREGAIVRR